MILLPNSGLFGVFFHAKKKKQIFLFLDITNLQVLHGIAGISIVVHGPDDIPVNLGDSLLVTQLSDLVSG